MIDEREFLFAKQLMEVDKASMVNLKEGIKNTGSSTSCCTPTAPGRVITM
jgi:hypothetical protein